jgi:hypothetical protein
MWPPKRWEIESGHIRISSWVQGERRRRRRRNVNNGERKQTILNLLNNLNIYHGRERDRMKEHA